MNNLYAQIKSIFVISLNKTIYALFNYMTSSSSLTTLVSSLNSSSVIKPTSSSNSLPYLYPKYKNTIQLLKDRNAWIPASIKLSAYGFIGIFFIMAIAKYTILAEIKEIIIVFHNKNEIFEV